jgi:hypothetical protein
VRINLIGGAIHDVDATAVRLPSGNTRREVFVGVSDAAVVLFFVFVFDRVRGGIAPEPELLDELIALFVVGELLKSRSLFVGEDPVPAGPFVAAVFGRPLSYPAAVLRRNLRRINKGLRELEEGDETHSQ